MSNLYRNAKRLRSESVISYSSDEGLFSDEINEKRNKLIQDKLGELVSLIEENDSFYYDFDKIKEDFIKSLKDNMEGMMNRCLECGTDMGRSNPRQLCGKSYCLLKELN